MKFFIILEISHKYKWYFSLIFYSTFSSFIVLFCYIYFKNKFNCIENVLRIFTPIESGDLEFLIF